MAIEVSIAWRPGFPRAVSLAVCLLATALSVAAQSTEQAYPTAVTESEISGVIRARDVGDPRLTAYYFTFNGGQGDLFLNVVTRNFSGDIDLFMADGLRPLTKIVVYADVTPAETGRVIYLRKPERLLLRIQGRTPNDDAAEFRLKFAGSFIAASKDDAAVPPKLPVVSAGDEGGIRVNSVGTILPAIEKPKPAEPVETAIVDDEKAIKKDAPVTADEPEAADDEKKVKEANAEAAKSDDDAPNAAPATPPSRRTARRSRRGAPPRRETKEPTPPKVVVTDTLKAAETPPSKTTEAPAPKAKRPDPMENVQLLIVFKDGRRVERPMTEVLRFTVDRGVLTVILKTGRINRFPMIDVESVSISR